MPTRNVVLTDRQARLTEGLVSFRRFQNPSEVLREGRRLLERAEGEYRARRLVPRQASQRIEVSRILHDAMDLPRHL